MMVSFSQSPFISTCPAQISVDSIACRVPYEGVIPLRNLFANDAFASVLKPDVTGQSPIGQSLCAIIQYRAYAAPPQHGLSSQCPVQTGVVKPHAPPSPKNAKFHLLAYFSALLPTELRFPGWQRHECGQVMKRNYRQRQTRKQNEEERLSRPQNWSDGAQRNLAAVTFHRYTAPSRLRITLAEAL